MTIAIHLTPKIEAWLERKASATGADKAAVAMAILDQAAETDVLQHSPDERLQRFRAWIRTVPARPGPPLDLSRESMYN